MVKPIVSQVTNTIPYFEYFSQKVLPAVYDDSLSYYEILAKVVQQLNDIGTLTNSTVDTWNSVASWIEGEGLTEATAEEINARIADGTIEGLINDGILADIKTQLGDKASASEVATITAQMNTLIANSTATDGNAELIDSRLASGGRTYTSAGVHIRTIEDFQSYGRTLGTDYGSITPITTSDATNSAGYYDYRTNVFYASSVYFTTVPTKCNYGDEYLVTTYISGPNTKVAMLLDANKAPLEMVGPAGNGFTDVPITALIRVDNPSAKFIVFTGLAAQHTKTLIRKKMPKQDSIETQKRTKGYYRVIGKPRIGMTDRAQLWLTFDIGANVNINPITIPFNIVDNVSGMNYRLYSGLTVDTYEAVVEYYGSTFIGEGVYNYLVTERDLKTTPDPTTGADTRYLQVFIDVILVDKTKPGNVEIPKFKVNGLDPIKVRLLNPNATDRLNNVMPFAEHSPLYKKKIVGLGDSLMYGNVSGNSITWFNKLGSKYDMDYYNHGDNGNPLADNPGETNPSMVERYMNMEDNADYIVLEAGANDKRLNVPMGDNDSTDITTFKGALNVTLDGLISRYPKGKILCMTNYNRYPGDVNTLGFSDWDYCQAMLDICRLKGIACFDNYHDSGLNWSNPVLYSWMDEGYVLNGTINTHISDEGYTWVMPKYEKALERL